MEDLAFLREYYRGDIFDVWLGELRARGIAHGSTLVHALGSPSGGRPGMSDNVDTAMRFLRAATNDGLIVRGKLQPTREQQFFDVNRSFMYTPGDAWVAYFYTLPVPLVDRGTNQSEP